MAEFFESAGIVGFVLFFLINALIPEKNSFFNEYECPFCKSKVPSGALVCASCGAFKGTKFKAGGYSLWPGFIMALLGLVMVFAGFDSKPEHNYWVMAVIGVVLFIVGGIVIYFTGKKGSKKTWLRKK